MLSDNIRTITLTCNGCPMQWNAELLDGMCLYIHWRGHRLIYGKGTTIEGAARAAVFSKTNSVRTDTDEGTLAQALTIVDAHHA